MAGQEISLDVVGQEARIKELSEENELLFEQLHVVQEELEKYYLKLKECEQSKGTVAVAAPSASLDPQLPETLAENLKLRALVAQQTLALRVETQNSLPSRLGDMLIKGVSSTGAFFALPGRLRKMWKALERTNPPAELGGKSFQKVIDAYGTGGLDAVEKLLDSVFIAPTMRANAYTALARQLMPSDAKKAASIARLAWETDPRPYRLKWLAFRMHDADDAVTAEAMLELLPADIPMSESEQRQVIRIRQESVYLRKKKAESDAGVQKQNNAKNQIIAQLTKQAEEQRHEADRLRQQQKEAQKHAETRQADLKALQARMVEQEGLAASRAKEIDALKAAHDGLQAIADDYKAEADALQSHLTAQAALAANRAEEIGALKTAQAELQARADGHKAEANALQARLTEQEALAASRAKEIDALKAAHDGLQAIADDYKAEADALQSHLTAQAALAANRAEEIGALKAVQADLQALADGHKAEANALQARLTEQEALAASRAKEIGALKAVQADLQALADGHKAEANASQARLTEQEALAASRAKEIGALKAVQADLQDGLIEAKKGASLLEATLEDIAYKNSISVFEKNNRQNRDDNIDAFVKDLDFFFNGKNITYVDVGANVGDVYSKIINTAKNFKIHEAHLYEPNPTSFSKLKKRLVDRNGVAHVYNTAIGVKDSLTFLPAKSMTKSVRELYAETALPDDIFQASCVKLDAQNIVITDGHINLLKIDVKGGELDVLSSAHELLIGQHVDLIYIEVGFNRFGTQQTYFAKIDEYLQPLGYRILRIYEQVDEWMSGSPILRRANLAYMSDNFSKSHPLKLMQELQNLKMQIKKLKKCL